jgi:hypothetical protein
MKLKKFVKEWSESSDNILDYRLVTAVFEKDNQFFKIMANNYQYHKRDIDVPEYIEFHLIINGVAVLIGEISLELITRVD